MDKATFELLFKFLSINTAYPPDVDLKPGVDFECIKEKIKLTHGYFLPEDLPYEQANMLVLYHYQYAQTKNPIVAVEAILVSHAYGFYPPLWALQEWLLPALQTFYEEKGTGKSLGELMRIKGGADSFRDLAGSTQYRLFMLQIYINRTHWGIPIAKTAHALSVRLKDTVWDGSGLNMGGVSESRLRSRYHSEKWEMVFHHEQVLKICTDEEKVSFLNIFSEKEKARILKKKQPKAL